MEEPDRAQGIVRALEIRDLGVGIESSDTLEFFFERGREGISVSPFLGLTNDEHFEELASFCRSQKLYLGDEEREEEACSFAVSAFDGGPG